LIAAQDILIEEAYNLLSQADKEKLSILDEEKAQHINLDDFLSNMYEVLSGIQHAISKTYFVHAQSQIQLFSTDQSGDGSI